MNEYIREKDRVEMLIPVLLVQRLTWDIIDDSATTPDADALDTPERRGEASQLAQRMLETLRDRGLYRADERRRA